MHPLPLVPWKNLGQELSLAYPFSKVERMYDIKYMLMKTKEKRGKKLINIESTKWAQGAMPSPVFPALAGGGIGGAGRCPCHTRSSAPRHPGRQCGRFLLRGVGGRATRNGSCREV